MIHASGGLRLQLALVVAALGVVAVPAAATATTLKSGYFKTPSGNIVCWYDLGWRTQSGTLRPLVICGIHSGLKPKPPYTRQCRASRLDYNADRIVLAATGRAHPIPCSGDAGMFIGEGRARVLVYGTRWDGGGLRCTSAITGLTCRNRNGRGFFLSRETWRTF